MPPAGRPPTKISQHNKVCLTTEEAKAVYECLNQDQVVSPIHFDKDLPKLHSIREAAYTKLEHILEEEGPLNPYEHALLHPNHKFPTKSPEIEDFYDMYSQGPKTPNTQNMEDWSILSTEIHYAHQKSVGTKQPSCIRRTGETPSRMGILRKCPKTASHQSPRCSINERLFGSI